jgi:hypothetical protein
VTPHLFVPPISSQNKKAAADVRGGFLISHDVISYGSLFSSATATVAGFAVRGLAAAAGVTTSGEIRRKPSMRDNQYSLKGEYITPPCLAEW